MTLPTETAAINRSNEMIRVLPLTPAAGVAGKDVAGGTPDWLRVVALVEMCTRSNW